MLNNIFTLIQSQIKAVKVSADVNSQALEEPS